jgi:hypothetical protein
MLKRARAIQISKESAKRKNFYTIPSYTTDLMEGSKKQATNWVANSYTIKGLSREMIFRKEGSDVAERLYPQHSHITKRIDGVGVVLKRTTTSSQDDIQNLIVKIMFECIDDKGYFRETDFDKYDLLINDSSVSKNAIQKYFKRNIPEIMDKYCLLKVRANKELKCKYGIGGNSSPFIFIKN